MYYWLQWFLVNIVIRVFFRKVYISGKENIPKDGPLLMVSNHPNGFFEPCVYACVLNFPLYFLVRGDLFENKFVSWFLRLTNQVPIYRFKDGFARMRSNTSFLSAVTERLIDGKRLLIFAEGSTKNIKRLRPLQMGMAKIAFESLELSPDLPLKMLPMAIHFTDSTRFRQDIKISIGKPLDCREYINAYKEDERAAIKTLTSDSFELIKKEMLHIQENKTVPVFNTIAKLITNDRRTRWIPIVEENGDPHKVEQELVEELESLSEESFVQLNSYTNQFEKSLKNLGISDRILSQRRNWVFNLIGFFVLLPLAAIGFILNLIPSGITFLLSATIIPRTVYYGSLSGLSRLGVHMYVIYPIFTIICIVKFGWIGILYYLVAPLTEWFFYRWWDQLTILVEYLKLFFSGKRKELAITRNQILDQI